MLVGFVIVALSVFLIVGKPVKTLVVVGALNGFILPIAVAAAFYFVGSLLISTSFKLIENYHEKINLSSHHFIYLSLYI